MYDINIHSSNFADIIIDGVSYKTTLQELERYRKALACVDAFCMWAYDLGDPHYYPIAYTDKGRAQSYAWHLNHARVQALKALHPDRNFDNLLTMGDYAIKQQQDEPVNKRAAMKYAEVVAEHEANSSYPDRLNPGWLETYNQTLQREYTRLTSK